MDIRSVAARNRSGPKNRQILPDSLMQQAAINRSLPLTRRARATYTRRKRKTRFRQRKSYQVAITLRDSSGHLFKRVRGWRQPVRTAMMLKNRVKTVQRRLDRLYTYQAQLEMLRQERQFLKRLGLKEDTSECGKLFLLSFLPMLISAEHYIQKAINDSQSLYERRMQNIKADLDGNT
ncbi:hypothetical protein EC973_001544 [Apophysomyces ossiformis]|uniref:Uncharacterized protein n=1 Tax=Apophysomyces ossiformis TaxID=679940 RepID=A0A8H7ENG3_9FUNG|nr:hypothetical protein EC973_001544 [Apophysomyces ossiformis]